MYGKVKFKMAAMSSGKSSNRTDFHSTVNYPEFMLISSGSMSYRFIGSTGFWLDNEVCLYSNYISVSSVEI